MGIVHYRWQMITVIFAQYVNPLTPTGMSRIEPWSVAWEKSQCQRLYQLTYNTRVLSQNPPSYNHSCFSQPLWLVTTPPVGHNHSFWSEPVKLSSPSPIPSPVLKKYRLQDQQKPFSLFHFSAWFSLRKNLNPVICILACPNEPHNQTKS